MKLISVVFIAFAIGDYSLHHLHASVPGTGPKRCHAKVTHDYLSAGFILIIP